MAITKVITKESVKESHGNKLIALKVTVADNGVDYDSRLFSLDYNKNDDVEEKVKDFKDDMQEFINQCIAEINTFNHQRLDDAVTWLNANTTP